MGDIESDTFRRDYGPTTSKSARKVAELEAERDRLAEALGRIADKAKYLSEPAWDREGCAFVGATIYRWASEALQGKGSA